MHASIGLLGSASRNKLGRIETGGFAKNDRITHRIALSTWDDIDSEVEKWLREAYERDTE